MSTSAATARVEEIAKIKEKEIIEWETLGNSFLMVNGPQEPLPDRLQKIPAGTYSVGRAPLRGYYLAPFKIVNDKIVELPNPHVERVMDSIRKFWDSRPRYDLYELLYKRGILLYGAPGTGKSVTINSLSEELIKTGGIVVYFDDPNTPVGVLPQLRLREPKRPVIAVFEDLDLMLDEYGEANLCKLLDGEYKIENIVYLATTNNVEGISSRIRRRPSRFDEVLEISVGRETREAYLRHLLSVEKYTDEELKDWTDKSDGLPLAHLKELLISVRVLGYSLDESVTRLKELSLDEDEDNE